MTHASEGDDGVVDLGSASALTRGIPTWMHEESTGEMDYRD